MPEIIKKIKTKHFDCCSLRSRLKVYNSCTSLFLANSVPLNQLSNRLSSVLLLTRKKTLQSLSPCDRFRLN